MKKWCTVCGSVGFGTRCVCGGELGVAIATREGLEGLCSRERAQFRVNLREAVVCRFPLARRWWLERARGNLRRFTELQRRLQHIARATPVRLEVG